MKLKRCLLMRIATAGRQAHQQLESFKPTTPHEERNMKSVDQRVKTIFSQQFAMDVGTVKNEATCESLGGDSLDYIEIIMAIEDDFGMEIPDEVLYEEKTVEQMVAYVTEKLA